VEQILLAARRRSRGRIANDLLPQLERDELRLPIRGNPQNRIRNETALQRPKSGKFGLLERAQSSSPFNGF
jgi:hypothetical protein